MPHGETVVCVCVLQYEGRRGRRLDLRHYGSKVLHMHKSWLLAGIFMQTSL